MSNVPTSYMADVWGVAPNDVFTVGSKIHHYDGSTWTSMSFPSNIGLSAVWGSSSSDVFAVGMHHDNPIGGVTYNWR
ncbi:MAG: hypothetical protein ACYS47_05630 [Planctomycetota bacterium]|jgi:hypothetical protein